MIHMSYIEKIMKIKIMEERMQEIKVSLYADELIAKAIKKKEHERNKQTNTKRKTKGSTK